MSLAIIVLLLCVVAWLLVLLNDESEHKFPTLVSSVALFFIALFI